MQSHVRRSLVLAIACPSALAFVSSAQAQAAPAETQPAASVGSPELEPAVDDLGPSSSSDDEEEVYEAVAEVEAPPRQATRRELDARELTSVPGTSGDPLKAIEVLPGVARTSDGDPILRGAAQHESAVFIDGMSVPFLYHFGSVRSVIHPRLVETVDVYPGNFSVRYGRATGGIVEAHMRDPRSDGLQARWSSACSTARP